MPKLTDITIKQLPLPARGQRSYYDDLPGFGVRVSQGGTRTFFVLLGSGKRHAIGKHPVISLSEARGEAKRLLAERTLGKTRPSSLAYDKSVEAFLSDCKQRIRPRTIYDYRRMLKRHFPFGTRQLSDLTPQDIQKRIDRLQKAPGEQKHALVAAKIFFNWAFRRGYVDRSPCERMRPPSPSSSRERFLSDAELAAVFGEAQSSPYPFGPIVSLLILTGQRRGEIAGLRWEWIDFKEHTITFPASFTKNHRTHRLPFGDMAARILEDLPKLDENEYVFPATRAHVRGKPSTVFNGWGKAKEDFDKCLENVAPYTLHDLRRTFSSGMAALGTPIHVTEKLLNHVSGALSGVAAVYNRHTYMDEMRTAIDAWEVTLASLKKHKQST